jgi:hypothetical protein
MGSSRPTDFIYGTNIAYTEDERYVLSNVIYWTDGGSTRKHHHAIVMWNVDSGVAVRSILCDSDLHSFTFIGEGLLASRHSNPRTIKLLSAVGHEQLEIAESEAAQTPFSSAEWDYTVHGVKDGFILTYLLDKSLWGRRFDGEMQQLACLQGPESGDSETLIAFSQSEDHIVLVFKNGFQIFRKRQPGAEACAPSNRAAQRPKLLNRLSRRTSRGNL